MRHMSDPSYLGLSVLITGRDPVSALQDSSLFWPHENLMLQEGASLISLRAEMVHSELILPGRLADDTCFTGHSLWRVHDCVGARVVWSSIPWRASVRSLLSILAGNDRHVVVNEARYVHVV